MMRWRWLWIFGGICTAVLFCGLPGWFIINMLEEVSNTLSPRESALDETHKLLAVIQDHPSGPMPDDLPGYLRVNDDCWIFLQESMVSNANQYRLTVTEEFDSPILNRVEVYMNIDFPDSRRAEMYYSQGGLSGCREK